MKVWVILNGENNMNNEPTILVKKANGMSVRMSLDEFKKMKTSSSTQILGASNVVNTVKKEEDKENQLKEEELKRKADEIRQKLRDDIIKIRKESENKSTKVESGYGNKDGVSKSLQNVVENIKDKSTLSGINRWEKDDHKSLLDDEFHQEKPVLVREGEHILARTTPVKDVFVNEAGYKNKIGDNKNFQFDKPKFTKNLDVDRGIIITNNKMSGVIPEMQPLNTKPLLQDVKPPKVEKQSVGPVDEMLNFTLEDFRRLGTNAEDSISKVKEKFEYLQEDSYLMFMEGVEAWYNSPIYKQYQDIISKSLKNRIPVAEVLSGSMADSDMKLDEFKAVLKLSKTLY
ncbi:MAG: hypothetical protein A2725_02030 [Candidatus Magasanikbacteria bacterium RIFCSPHIGHO2_01_FULL_33_34]|uniref:Uncharacterized protein n=1 Tax=Candidatus Magasanikbacteria bacterium RIFCSPHIGHO2_01_FULL_33_34 TaxID=1798671 RepID=A0A1F6LKC3_9BACT|nr:MAG: hypothetical protein A2725_02030 [Candidatus Magasanikbacteria bacterium RIFCSPHIGHO2_01_FULL_33_34]OGH65548.1 MAG: hypothetical protein A3B83_01605 [Candidatus Magasanikbacteria bacterium RIFCSPHIGHO2_02_FULL_33_17]OGH76258.1 MAG: hypothetical protein A3A89_02425 [Candidatus Magasanikbacteria bacterium RIFCSPLOWO2_01_FULL_33_34]